MKIKKKLCLMLASIATLIPLTFAATPVFAIDSVCDSPDVPEEIKSASGCSGTNQTADISSVVLNIVNGVLAVLGVVAVVVIVYGGVLYMTSTGDAGKAKKARDTILYAAIGLIVSALSFAIVNFVLVGIIGKRYTTHDSDIPKPGVSQPKDPYTVLPEPE